MHFFYRKIEIEINKIKAQYPIIVVTGPRQSGKTTMLKNLFPNFQYVNLENPDNYDFAMNDTKGFLTKYNEYTIFDEAQKIPKLFSYLQDIVDSSQKMGQFILSGSQNFQLMQNITQSLAGRVAIFKLLPFDFGELQLANHLPIDYSELIYKGSYPAIYDRNLNPTQYYSNYVQTYVERDVVNILSVHNTKSFRNFVRICAGRAGQILNLNNIANECDISQPTAKEWLSVLESSYIIFQLQPYFENFNKRVLKKPKLYFYDTGLLAFLLGIKNKDAINSHRLKGNLFENLIISEIIKRKYHNYLYNDYYYWMDSNGNEVDLLSEIDDKLNIFEIKSTQTISQDLFKNMIKFANVAKGKVDLKTLIYGGLENQKRTDFNVYGWRMI